VNNSIAHILSKLPLLLFLSASLLYGYITFHYVKDAEVWGPYDELPHVDYMDRIAFEKRFPRDGEMISDRTHRFHLDLETVNGPGYDGSKAGLGPIGYSYEAHQPPVYYLVMAVPYKIIQEKNWPARKKIKCLRMLSFGLHFLGILMVLPLFGEVRKLFPQQLEKSYGYVLFFTVWLLSVNLRFGISNDHLSMLTVNCALFFLARLWRKRQLKNALLSCVFCTLAFFTKYTNLLAVGAIGLLLLYFQYTRFPLRDRWKFYLSYFPLLLIPGWFLFLVFQHGTNNPLGNDFSKQMFSIMQPGMFSYRDFLKLQFIDFFSFYYLMIFYKKQFLFGSILFLAGFGSYLLNLFFVPGRRPYWTICILATLALYAAMYFLNKNVCCIVWFSFRLYSGYMVFLAVTLTGYLSIRKKGIEYLNILLLILLHYPAIHYLLTWA
jgi:hypothetical protein